jgi:hypothetical protein
MFLLQTTPRTLARLAGTRTVTWVLPEIRARFLLSASTVSWEGLEATGFNRATASATRSPTASVFGQVCDGSDSVLETDMAHWANRAAVYKLAEGISFATYFTHVTQQGLP